MPETPALAGRQSHPIRAELHLNTVMSKSVACTELSALREHHRRMTALWARHMHPDSALRLEAAFAMDVAVRLLDLHRF